MSVIQYSALSRMIKSGVSGGFLFCGEEEYLKSYWRRQLRAAAVADPDDMFNRYVITGENYTPQYLKDAIEALPAFSDRKFVEVSGLTPLTMKDSELDELCAVLSIIPEHPETTVLLFCADDELPYVDTTKYISASHRKAASIQNKLASQLTVVAFLHETPSKLAQWTIRHFQAYGVECPAQTARLLISVAGNDMFRLSSETDKLSAYILSSGRKTVTDSDIRLNVKEAFEFGEFDFSNALLSRDRKKAFRILREMRGHPDASKLYPPELIIGSVSRIWSDLTAVKSMLDSGVRPADITAALKMNPYKAGLYMNSAGRLSLEEISAGLDACRRCDRLMKSSPIDNSVLLDRLVLELCS